MADRSYSSPGGPRAQGADAAAEAEAFAQLAAMPAAVLVAETAASLANLAAMRLSRGPDGTAEPDLDGARLLIDALAGLLESAAGRIGQVEPQLRQALAQLRLAYVNAGGGRPATQPAAAASQGSAAQPPPSGHPPPSGQPAEQQSDISRPRSGLWVPGQPL
jgi:hypothetical protein